MCLVVTRLEVYTVAWSGCRFCINICIYIDVGLFIYAFFYLLSIDAKDLDSQKILSRYDEEHMQTDAKQNINN